MTDKKIKELLVNGEIENIPEEALMSYLAERSQIQGLPNNAIKHLIYLGMIDKVPKEDLEMMEENYNFRKHLSPDGISNLYKMICLQAVEDYKETRKEMGFRYMSKAVRENIEKRQKELEHFFGTEFFLHNSGCPSAEYVIKNIERQLKARANMSLVH